MKWVFIRMIHTIYETNMIIVNGAQSIVQLPEQNL